jgi:hypothetical protein
MLLKTNKSIINRLIFSRKNPIKVKKHLLIIQLYTITTISVLT